MKRPHPATINKDHDVSLMARDDLDHPERFKKPWLVQFANGKLLEFDNEKDAAKYQRDWRTRVGRDPMTGEKLIPIVRN